MFELVPMAALGRNAETGQTNGRYMFTPYQNCIVHGIIFEPLDTSSGNELLAEEIAANWLKLAFGVLPSGTLASEGLNLHTLFTVPLGVTGDMNTFGTAFYLNNTQITEEVGPVQFMVRPFPLTTEKYILFPISDSGDNANVSLTASTRPIKSVRLLVEYVDVPFRWVQLFKEDMSVALDANSYNSGGGITECFELHTNGRIVAVEVRIPHDNATNANQGTGVPALYYRSYPYGDAYQDAVNSTKAASVPRGVVRYPLSSADEAASATIAQRPTLGILPFIDDALTTNIMQTLWTPSIPENKVRTVPTYPIINTHVQRWYLGENNSGTFVPMTAARLAATGAQVWVLIQE